MRVRHLQSHIEETKLKNTSPISDLRNRVMAIDAVTWLRSIQALKDPFAEPLGGVPPGIFNVVDAELDHFKSNKITPVFVFQGMAPALQPQMFASRPDQQTEIAWHYMAQRNKSEAQKLFAVSTSRINADFVHFIMHHLKTRECDVIQAPYFVGPQLAHLMKARMVDCCYGVPGLLLYGIDTVIISLDQNRHVFDWISLQKILSTWSLSHDRLIDACMLAGTEQCMTFPQFNVETTAVKFSFNWALETIRTTNNILQLTQLLPSDQLKNEHIQNYTTCRALITQTPMLNLETFEIVNEAGQMSSNIDSIIGPPLPKQIYALLSQCVIGHKLPLALALKKWVDKTQPLVDTQEFREVLGDLLWNSYRLPALALLARNMPQHYQSLKIQYMPYWRVGNKNAEDNGQLEEKDFVEQVAEDLLAWQFTQADVEAELNRQVKTNADLTFCLKWHDHDYNKGGQKMTGALKQPGRSTPPTSKDHLSARVHFLFLEKLNYIDAGGDITTFGSELAEAPQEFAEPLMVALQLLADGQLSSDPFNPAEPKKPFPPQLSYPRPDNVTKEQQAEFLLSRTLSLIPVKTRKDMWNADVDFDLAAFGAIVRIYKRSMRQLLECCLAHVLMETNLSAIDFLPPTYLSPTPVHNDPLETRSLFPSFMISRAALGILCKAFLNFRPENPGTASAVTEFSQYCRKTYSCCEQPARDLARGFRFFRTLHKIVGTVTEGSGDENGIMQEFTESLNLMENKLKDIPIPENPGQGVR